MGVIFGQFLASSIIPINKKVLVSISYKKFIWHAKCFEDCHKFLFLVYWVQLRWGWWGIYL